MVSVTLHRDGGRNRAVTSWRAFSPGQPVGGRCDGNRSVRFRPFLSIGVRESQNLTRGRKDRIGNGILTASNLRRFILGAGTPEMSTGFCPDTGPYQPC
jgi:hypothetical protein